MVGMPFKDQTAVAGEEHTQVLTISVKAGERFVAAKAPGIVELRAAPGKVNGRMPQLGMSIEGFDCALSLSQNSLLKEFGGFLYAHLDCASPRLEAQAQAVESFAKQTGQPVYLTLSGITDERVTKAIDVLASWKNEGVRLLQLDVMENAHPGLVLIRAAAREAGFQIPCGKRVNSFKERSAMLEAADSGADFLAWSGTPFIHQADDETLTENASTWRDQALTARSFAPQIRTSAGPVRLIADSPASMDPRYRGLIAASFVASSVRSLAEGEVDLAVLFDAVGPRGHLDHNETPQGFPSFYVLQELSGLAGSSTFPIISSMPLAIQAFGVQSKESRVTIVINLTAEKHQAMLSGVCREGTVLQVRVLDETTYPQLGSDPNCWGSQITAAGDGLRMTVLPFSVSFISENAS